MADKKVTELSAITSLSGDDLLLVVNDPSGTPSSRKVTLTNLFANVVPSTTFKTTVTHAGNTSITGTTMTITSNVAITSNLSVNSVAILPAINDRMQVANVVNDYTTNTAFQSFVANTNSRFTTIDTTFTSNSYIQVLTGGFVANSAFQSFVANTNNTLANTYVSNTQFQAYIANTNPRLDSIVGTYVSNTVFQAYSANTNSWISGLDATLVTNSYFQAYFSNAALSSVGSITFDANEGASVVTRQLLWDTDAKTASLGLENDVVLEIGQDQHALVRNSSGSTIQKGVAVYTDGSSSVDGDEYKLTIQLFTGDGTINPEKFVGLSTQQFDNGLIGYCTTFGYVRNLDTRGSVSNNITDGTESWSGGDILYVHPTAAGKLTNEEPIDPIEVGVVVKVGQTDGIVFVRPIIPAPTLVHAKFTITANGTTGYCFAGSGAANTNNETLYLYKGMTYKFNNTTGASHPFQILNTAGGSAFSNGVSGSQTGVQYFTVPHAQQSNLVYQCSIHSGMQGTLAIVS